MQNSRETLEKDLKRFHVVLSLYGDFFTFEGDATAFTLEQAARKVAFQAKLSGFRAGPVIEFQERPYRKEIQS